MVLGQFLSLYVEPVSILSVKVRKRTKDLPAMHQLGTPYLCGSGKLHLWASCLSERFLFNIRGVQLVHQPYEHGWFYVLDLLQNHFIEVPKGMQGPRRNRLAVPVKTPAIRSIQLSGILVHIDAAEWILSLLPWTMVCRFILDSLHRYSGLPDALFRS